MNYVRVIKYLKSYDTQQESKHIIDLDTNNLYGYAMSKCLPTGGFKLIYPKEFDMNNYTRNSSKGCVLEVDLDNPKELRELHISAGNVKKLVSNFFEKEKYVLQYESLQLYLRIQLKLKKIHRVLEFNQLQWLKPNVEFNTQKRIDAEKKEAKDGKVLH